MKKILSLLTLMIMMLSLTACLGEDVVMKEKPLTQLYDELSPSVVTVESYQMNQLIGSGSGLVFDKKEENGDTNYYVLTNHHVVEGASHTRIYFTQENYEIGDVYMVSQVDNQGDFLSHEDVAIVRFTSNKNYRVQEVLPYHNGQSIQSKIGEKVFAIGSPLGIEFHRLLSNEGTIGGLSTYWTIHGATINPGNSGGPLYSSVDGTFVGMNTQRVETTTDGKRDVIGVGMAINANQVAKIIKELLASAKQNPKIGINIINSHSHDNPLGETVKGFLDIVIDGFTPKDLIDESIYGVVVTDVSLTRSAAGKLKAYDVITHVNNMRVETIEQLTAAVGKITLNQTIQFKVNRKTTTGYEVVDVTLNIDKL